MRRNLSLPPNRQARPVSLPASKTRAASIAPQGDQRVPQRDMKSKAAVSRAIANLIEFLEMTEYPNAISTRLLQSPTSKEVYFIFEHIIRQISPSFRVERQGTKAEELCLNALRQFGYPNALSKQYLATPGAPHAWPSVLAALDWLREEALEASQLLEASSLFKYDDNQDVSLEPVGKILHNFHLKAFHLELQGMDIPEDFIQEFQTEISRLFGCPDPQEIAKLQQQIAQLDSELNACDDADTRIRNLQEQLATLRTTTAERDQQLERVQVEVDALESQCHEVKQTEAELSKRNADLKKQIASAKKRIKEQEDAGFGSLVQEYRMLQERSQSRSDARNRLQKEVEQLELAYSRREGQVAPVLDAYNRLVGTLKVPEYESVAKACNLKIRTYCAGFDIATELSAMLSDVKKSLSHIHSLVGESERRLEQATRQLLEIHSTRENLALPTVRLQVSELQDELAKLEELIAAEDETQDLVEKDFLQERAVRMVACTEVRTSLSELRGRLSELKATVINEKQALQGKTDYLDEIERAGSMFATAFQNFLEVRKYSAQERKQRLVVFRQRLDQLNERLDRKVEQALEDAHLWKEPTPIS